jgi:hypothetical protein
MKIDYFDKMMLKIENDRFSNPDCCQICREVSMMTMVMTTNKPV